jgi:ABC-type branched-subunit amino acid transport system substrate-binding protein
MKAKADCLLFLGMGAPTLTFMPAARKLGWKVPVYSNIAMLVLASTPGAIAKHEGIIWPDQYYEGNAVLRRVKRAYTKRWDGPPPPDFRAYFGYDMMTLVAEALRRAHELTRAGLKAGLEQVRNIPCATGGRNPAMGFAPWDHAAIKGPDLFMFRTVRKGKVVTLRA